MGWNNWVLDASMGWPPCFCPVEGDIDGDFTVVTGMNLIGKPPGKVVAVIHPDGQEAADAYMAKHGDEIKEFLA